MGLHWLLIWGPMAVSKGIVLALDLGTSSCSKGRLAFDLEPQSSQGALRSSKGSSLTLDLGNLACSRGQLPVDMGPHLGPGVMASEGAQLTIDLEPLAQGANCLLIWGPCLLHGTPLALDLEPEPAPGAP